MLARLPSSYALLTAWPQTDGDFGMASLPQCFSAESPLFELYLSLSLVKILLRKHFAIGV